MAQLRLDNLPLLIETGKYLLKRDLVCYAKADEDNSFLCFAK